LDERIVERKPGHWGFGACYSCICPDNPNTKLYSSFELVDSVFFLLVNLGVEIFLCSDSDSIDGFTTYLYPNFQAFSLASWLYIDYFFIWDFDSIQTAL
jgi:hypothetical protein